MALIIEAPNEIYSVENYKNTKMFLAGGITNCSDWQSFVISELRDIENLTIFNPRRKKFPINDPKAAEEQITWEFRHLIETDILFFWFAKGSLNPIVLYEYGAHAMFSERPLIVGIDPEYERKQDVIIQTNLARPNCPIYDSLTDMIEEIHYIFETYINKNEDE